MVIYKTYIPSGKKGNSLAVPAREKIVLLSGNEAIARGAYEAGVTVASAYPGTPSTEILENFARYEGVYAEWAPNEKVSVEVARGAAMAGARALAVMKHVGVNVAADPIFTASYTGVRGGFVIVTADDPELHSSQNEQDNRHYAVAAKIPMLEPSDSWEAKEFTRLAFDLSEKFDTPVFLRSTTRISHAKGAVRLGDVTGSPLAPGFVRDPAKWVMLPDNARPRHGIVEGRVARLVVLEELDPHIETHVKTLGLPVQGKEIIPIVGELSPRIVREGITGVAIPVRPAEGRPRRPPNLCPGCPHRGLFYVLKKFKATVAGDIGCYTLAALPPLTGVDPRLSLGAAPGD